MKKILLFASALAVLGLTACERTLDVGEDNASRISGDSTDHVPV